MKLSAVNSHPLYVTFRRPITVMNKIRKWHKEQEIAAELGNHMDCIYELNGGNFMFSYFIWKRIQNDI